MIVGVLEVDLAIFEAQNLKDRRRIIKGLKERIRHRFNVSVSEVDHADRIQRCRLGVAMVAEGSRPVHAQFDKIVDLIRATSGVTLLDYERAFH
jgi:uncharacterized protein